MCFSVFILQLLVQNDNIIMTLAILQWNVHKTSDSPFCKSKKTIEQVHETNNDEIMYKENIRCKYATFCKDFYCHPGLNPVWSACFRKIQYSSGDLLACPARAVDCCDRGHDMCYHVYATTHLKLISYLF